MTCKIAPSLLSANFLQLEEQVQELEKAGADWLHLDVMDGHFVPNLTFGPLLVKAFRTATTLPLDVHLMIEHPERYLIDFASAGADFLTVHVESCPHLHRTIQQIKSLGCRAGVALNPATPLLMIEEILAEVDLVLIAAVNPGFGGQELIPAMIAKITRLREWLDIRAPHVELEVDGGLNPNTVTEVAGAGATVLVVGSAVFNDQGSISKNIHTLRLLSGKHSK